MRDFEIVQIDKLCTRVLNTARIGAGVKCQVGQAIVNYKDPC